jgi:hypothetical protein
VRQPLLLADESKISSHIEVIESSRLHEVGVNLQAVVGWITCPLHFLPMPTGMAKCRLVNSPSEGAACLLGISRRNFASQMVRENERRRKPRFAGAVG